METDRKTIERRHGAYLAASAEDAWGWSTPAGRVRVSRRIREAACYLDKKTRILEFGCGTGVFTRELLNRGYQVVSFDISFELAEQVRRKMNGTQIIIADAEYLPFADASFEAVFGVSVLHHLDLESALKQMRRVLKKGGVLVFSEPNMANPQILLQKNISWLKRRMKDTPTETAFLRGSISKKLIEAGFVDVMVRPFEFLHPRVPSGLISAIRAIEPFLESCPVCREIAGSLLITARKL
jgi:SAM-dependent methyltransferase